MSCTLAVVGDGSVGKSSIIHAFKSDGFDKVYKQTVGCDFFEKKIKIRGEEMISLRVWDIGGQSMNSKNLPDYLSSSNVVFIVYDVTNPDSFQNLDDWIVLVRRHAPSNAKISLVGNKIDMVSQRQVSQSQHDKFILDNGMYSGFFMSAKTRENVVKAFYKAAADSLGIKLSEYDLAFYDVVVKAYIQGDVPADADEGEGKVSGWEDIEREDREAEERKKKKKGICVCS